MNENNTEYTFSDVLIKPKYSEVMSRKNVVLTSSLKGFTVNLPVIAANMKNVCGSKMAIAMYKAGGMGFLYRRKHQTIDQAVQEFKKALIGIAKLATIDDERLRTTCGISIGVQETDKERFDKLYEAGARIICIDVAHGHHLHVKNMITWLKSLNYKDITIIAGNIATGEAAQDLSTWGADIVKVGIGPGCFISGTKIKTNNGYKNIENINIDDMVLTHNRRYKKIVQTTNRKETKKIININGNKCTENHEFYVVHKKYLNIITDDNINQYAEWVPAKNLTKDYLLLKNKI